MIIETFICPVSSISNPDEFVRFVLNDIYTGKKNKNMVEKFKPMVRKAFSAFINDIVNQKLNEVFDTM